jgi:hypothetical protein
MSDNSEAKLDLTADDKVAQRAIDNLTKRMAGLEEQNRKLNETAKKGAEESRKAVDQWAAGMEKLSAQGKKVHDDIEAWDRGMANIKKHNADLREQVTHHGAISHFLSEQSTELVGIGTSYVSITKGIEMAMDMVGEWRNRVKELGQEHENVAKNLTQALHSGGMMKFGPELEEFARGGAGGIATPDDVIKAMSGAMAGAPKASAEEIRALSTEGVKGAALGVDPKERTTLIAKLHTLFPEKSANDLADVSQFATQMAGTHADQLTSAPFAKAIRYLKAGGLGSDEAGSLATSFLQSDEKMKSFAELGEILDPENKFKAPGGPHRLTPEERLKQEFGQLGTQDRLKAFMDNSELARAVSPKLAFAFKATPQSERDEMLAGWKGAQAENLDQQTLGQAGRFDAGRQSIAAYDVKLAEAAQAEDLGGMRAALTRFDKRRYAQTRNMTDAVGAVGHIGAAEIGYELYSNPVQSASAAVTGNFAGGQNMQQVVELLRQVVKHVSGTEQNTKKRGGVNINAHTEAGR